MSARYAVVGHPITHSKSPQIHAAFARQTGEKLTYDRIEAPLDGFEMTVAEFFASGGAGLNVTVPFKEEAFRFANILTERASLAGAVNTLWLDDDGVVGDTTDGAGLVRDLLRHCALAGRRVLLLGAGGAARGCIGALLDEQPACLHIANRSADKAATLASIFAPEWDVPLTAGGLDELGGGFDVVINASSASLAGATLPLVAGVFSDDAVAYDMMYGKGETPFMQQAKALGATQVFDGLGMLVEQAAEAFFIWRGKRPETLPVLADLRAAL